jgi:hypothetical protein
MVYYFARDNTILRGYATSFFDGLSLLEHIDVSRCTLQGDVPKFAQSTKISHIDLGYNELAGDIPSSWAVMDLLTSLRCVSVSVCVSVQMYTSLILCVFHFSLSLYRTHTHTNTFTLHIASTATK